MPEKGAKKASIQFEALCVELMPALLANQTLQAHWLDRLRGADHLIFVAGHAPHKETALMLRIDDPKFFDCCFQR